MNELYLRPVIVNAGVIESNTVDSHEGLFPLVEAAAAGYAAGKSLRKVLGGVFPSSMLGGLENRKQYKE